MLADNARQHSMSPCSTFGKLGSIFYLRQFQWQGVCPSQTTVTLSSTGSMRFLGTYGNYTGPVRQSLDHHRPVQNFRGSVRGKSRQWRSCGGGCRILRAEQNVRLRCQEEHLPIGGARPQSCSHFPILLPAIQLNEDVIR